MLRDNASGLRAWFEQWTISEDFNPDGNAPITRYLQEMADAAATPLAVYFTGTSAWAGTISSDDATGHLAVEAGTEITATTGTTVGVVLAVTILES